MKRPIQSNQKIHCFKQGGNFQMSQNTEEIRNAPSIQKILRVHFDQKTLKKQNQNQQQNDSPKNGIQKKEETKSCRSASSIHVNLQLLPQKNQQYYMGDGQEDQQRNKGKVRKQQSQNCFQNASSRYIIITRKDLTNSFSNDYIKSTSSLKTHSEKSFKNTNKNQLKIKKEDRIKSFFSQYLKIYEGTGFTFIKEKAFCVFKEGQKNNVFETQKYLKAVTDDLLKKNRFNGQQIYRFRKRYETQFQGFLKIKDKYSQHIQKQAIQKEEIHKSGNKKKVKQNQAHLSINNQVIQQQKQIVQLIQNKAQTIIKNEQQTAFKNQKERMPVKTIQLSQLKKFRFFNRQKAQKQVKDQVKCYQFEQHNEKVMIDKQKHEKCNLQIFSERSQLRRKLKHIKSPSSNLQVPQGIRTQKNSQVIESHREKQKMMNKIRQLQNIQNAFPSLEKQSAKYNYFQIIAISSNQTKRYQKKNRFDLKHASNFTNGQLNLMCLNGFQQKSEFDNKNSQIQQSSINIKTLRGSLHRESRTREPSSSSMLSIQSWVMSRRMNIKGSCSKQKKLEENMISCNPIKENLLRNIKWNTGLNTPKISENRDQGLSSRVNVLELKQLQKKAGQAFNQ